VRQIRVLLTILLLAPLSLGAPGHASEVKSPPASLRDLIAGVAPWVVAIDVEREKDISPPRVGRGPRPEGRPGELQDYFRRPQGPVSGLLVDAEGHVLTSHYNVAGDLKSLQVTFADGTRRPARLVAVAPADDLALLGLLDGAEAPKDLENPPWAETVPGAGRIVFALGRAPDPQVLTVTEGIVSASARNGSRTLQTDAKLNYGNVGGPLVDLDGRIVGITGFVGHVHPQWGLNSGIGFAAHVGTIREILPLLKSGQNHSAREPPFLGIRSDTLTAIEGAPVVSVVTSGPAAKAGLLADDVILEFAGQPVQNFAQLRRLIYAQRVDDVVTLKFRRGKEVIESTVTLAKRPERM
jgi:serine protease DegQ